MNKSILALSVALGVALCGAAQAGDIVPVYGDAPNTGYFDPTAAAPVAGNPGTTVGEQRRIVAQFAADLWGAVLVSDVPVLVGARFVPLAPNVLGSAGTTYAFANFPGAGVADTWYVGSLAESLAGENLNPENVIDINSNFSTNFAFYLGLDGNTPAGQISLLDVVMHEYGHGLGFANLETEATGAWLLGAPDIYSTFTFDNSTGKYWTEMDDAQRRTSAINYGNVVFTGANAKAGAALILNDRTAFRITAPAAIAREFSYGTASFGAPVTPANFNGTIVVGFDEANAAGPTTTDGCTAFTADVAGKIAIVDRGTCGFAVKAANAQAAGAIGLIVANNAVANPPPGLGGVDPNVTIPTISVTQADGALIKANAPATGGFVVDATKLQGADDLGRPRLYMPEPVAGGSSGSHYDTNLAPNALMEPAINDSLHAGLTMDISAALLEDTGWRINKGPARINGCSTEVPVIADGGLIIGANIIATSNLIASTSADKIAYMARMEAYRDSLEASGLINGRQGGKVMQCAGKISGTFPKL